MAPGTEPRWDRLSRRLSRRFTVERMAPERTEDLCLFLKRAYADQPLAHAFEDAGRVLQRLRWLLEPLPGPGGEKPLGWICLKQGRIVGYFTALPALAAVRGRELPVWWGRELMVAPEARREGVGPLLVIAAVRAAEERPFLIAGLNDESYPLFRRMGFLDMGRIPLHVRIALAARVQRLLFRRGRREGTFSVVPLERFDERYDRWWKGVEAAFPCVIRRDGATMAWRYLRHPDHRYAIFAAMRGGELCGVGVARRGRSRGRPAGFITELLVNPGDPEALRGLIAHAEDFLCGERGALAFIRCAALHPAVQRALSRAGYLGVPSPIHWMMAHARGPSALGGLSLREDWFLNGGDSDLDVV